ncbi:myc box-dependent-interacting protein 1 [Oncorhynchus tshawytscha]|uniref:myc box-dependent-interacting protein 1 n=1 Tax=Oncorhynchus tshawytscha TaxID=74940 RepID=UPI001C3E1D56|nr:myc box-dependent-interacting protein 1 [Oncorhynchus tshawytscha]
MAEMGMGKGVTAGKLASNVQKKLTRAQEKVMQKLGKADETRDVAFEEGVINFNKQYTEGSKLQKDLRAYLAAVQTMHESSKNLQECLSDMYEPEWYGKDDLDSIVEDTDVLWTDFHQKLVDNALISMDTYLGQFPDIKSRIAKRDRKLVDYDSARHNHSSTNKGKKGKDGGIKITKPASLLERATPVWAQGILSAHNIAQSNLSRNQLMEGVGMEINEDLQEELPSLWNSRVGFYISTFQSMSGFEEKFHKEMGKLDQNLYDILVKLEKQDMSGELPRGADPANHTLSPGGPPPIPKSPSKLRPAMPPRPESSPCRDMKPENIINLFDAAAAPNISVTSPTQFDSPAGANLLDMDLSILAAPSHGGTAVSSASQAVSWDTWEPEETPAPPEEPQGWDDDGTLPVRAAGWDDDGTLPVRAAGWDDDGTLPVRAAGCGDDGTLPVRAAGCGDDGTLPVRAAGWGDDGTLPVRAAGCGDDGTLPVRAAGCGDDGIAATTAGWDDDGSLPVRVDDSWGDDGVADATATAAVAESEAAGWDDDEEGVPQADTLTTPAAPTPAAAAPEETPVVAAAATNGDSEAVEMPPGFLFKVTTMHDYAANDSDELEMKAGDIVLVVAFDNPEEQDEGWLMGMKQEDWIQNKQSSLKGVFPENFTSRL